MTVFQCVTLEGWIDTTYHLQDTIAPWLPALYFILLVTIGSFFFLNFLLAVV